MLFNEFNPTKVRQPRGPDIAIPEGFDGLGAAFGIANRNGNWGWQYQRMTISDRADLARSALGILGPDAATKVITESGRSGRAAGIGAQTVREANPGDPVADMGEREVSRVLDMARADASANPDKWKAIDLTDEGIAARVTQRQIEQDNEETAIVSMMPKGSGLATLVAEIGSAASDPRTLPLMLLGGGGGSILKIIGREAGLNTLAEGVTFADRKATAERLGKPAPDLVDSLAIAAIGGAAFGAAFEGIARGAHYFMGRSAIPKAFADSPVLAEDAISAAEQAMHAGKDPLAAIKAAMRDTPEPREPLIPQDTPMPKEPGPVVGGVDPIKTLPIRNADQPMEVATINKMADAAIAQADDSKHSKPLTQFFRKSGKPTKAQIAKAEREGQAPPSERASNQIHPDGPIAAELKAQDITPRSHPGLFSRRGRKDIDNFVASEMEESFPGIIDATRTPYGSDYLDRQGLLDLLIRDANGDASWLRSRADVMAIQRAADDAVRAIEEGSSAVDNFVSGAKAPDGFFVDLNAYHFDQDGDVRIEADLDAYVAQKGIRLSARDRAEILGELQSRGGDGAFLVERSVERDFSGAERQTAQMEANDGKDPFADSGGTQAGDPGARPEAFGQPEPVGGKSGDGGTGDAQPYSFERTSAGQQAVTPGVAPITARDRLEASQRAPMGRSGAREPDSQIGGLFDPNDKARSDMFDDPAGPKAQPIQTQISNDFRDMIDEGNDFPVGVEDADGNWSGLTKADGTPLRTASAALDYLDEGDNFSARIDLCGKGPA